MPATTYFAVEGTVYGERTALSRTDYLTDALGSVTATADGAAAVVNTYRHKPYGERLAKTGSGADPRFQWTGSSGSQRTALLYADQYNRARHLGTRQGSWIAIDPLWPVELAYSYVSGAPVDALDPSGLLCEPTKPSCCCCPDNIGIQDLKYYKREKVVPYPGIVLGKEFDDHAGASFAVVPEWTANAQGSPKPKSMPSCKMSWDEMWTSDKTYGRSTPNALGERMWNHPSCVRRRTTCGSSGCAMFDAPGANAADIIPDLKKRKKGLRFEVCIRVRLDTSCAKGKCAKDRVESLYKFTLVIDNPYINPSKSIRSTFSKVSYCKTNTSLYT